MGLTQFFEGNMCNAYEYFGAHIIEEGVIFRTYAPHALSIHVIGDFNDWKANDESLMKRINSQGIYELLIPNATVGDFYKFQIKQALGNIIDKQDPFAFETELRPKTASVITNIHEYQFNDELWMKKRTRNIHEPMNIYELHLGAWKLRDNQWYQYEEIADELITYCKKMHYTHVEFMPLSEHPFDGSWGYQTTGYFSITSRYGNIHGLKKLIDKLHQNDIGVIIDFVPVHFAKDVYALSYFDGTPLYEYDREEDANNEWGTSNFNLWRNDVRSFLMSAANFWLDVLHFDGIRMDAIANLIYWQGRKENGVNQGAITFVKRMNEHLHKLHPTAFLIAEDSSSYENVTSSKGLGFDYKWDLGWMNDTLRYLQLDPNQRIKHHHMITWSMVYAFNEKYILPLSHDEVVHGKKTIVEKMWGSYEERFSQARTLYLYMMTHPGKKLNFMGNEIAHMREFDVYRENDWDLLKYPMHDSFQKYICDLNKMFIENEAFYKIDSWDGFKWMDADNCKDSIYIYQRIYENQKYMIILNFSNNYYHNYQIGIENYSYIKEILNTDKDIYSGSNIINSKTIRARKENVNQYKYSVKIEIAPFSGIIFEVKELKKYK